MEPVAWNTLEETARWRKLMEQVNLSQEPLEKAQEVALQQLFSAAQSTAENRKCKACYEVWLDRAEDYKGCEWEISTVSELRLAERQCHEAANELHLAARFATPKLHFWFNTARALHSTHPFDWKLVELDALFEELLMT